MRKFMEKVVGVILIVLGAIPFLLKIKTVAAGAAKLTWVSWFSPGNYVYQILIILIGLFIIIERKVEYNL